MTKVHKFYMAHFELISIQQIQNIMAKGQSNQRADSKNPNSKTSGTNVIYQKDQDHRSKQLDPKQQPERKPKK